MKNILISYSPDAEFQERRFVAELVRQMKENNLSEDIWFDEDEKIIDSPCWFSFRLEAAEKCRAAFLVLSYSYFMSPVSIIEGEVLLRRQVTEPSSIRLFPILFSKPHNKIVPKQFLEVVNLAINLTDEHDRKTSAEKTSVVVGSVMKELEIYATAHTSHLPIQPADSELRGQFKKKKVCYWNTSDLQEWLLSIGIQEFYCLNLSEAMVDGFLLVSLTDHDMIVHLGIENRVIRRKIMQQLLCYLEHEHKQADSWHLRARAQRPKFDVVYMIYDPADVRLAQSLKADLKTRNLQVLHHNDLKLGSSKEEFLQINGSSLATASYVIVMMTETLPSSAFIFQEVLFADWFGKRLIIAMFRNVWSDLRASLKAVLGDCPAVDFEAKMYVESLDVLLYHIKPLKNVSVVLEQTYLNKMAECLQPLEILAKVKQEGGLPKRTYHKLQEPPV